MKIDQTLDEVVATGGGVVDLTTHVVSIYADTATTVSRTIGLVRSSTA